MTDETRNPEAQAQIDDEIAAERAATVDVLTKGINYLGWDTRFQESAADLANKLVNAIDAISAQEGEAEAQLEEQESQGNTNPTQG